MFSPILHPLHCSYRNCLFKNLPYRYFNEPLVLYSDFSDSRQISLLRFSIAVCGLSHHEPNGLFLHCKRLLFADHKDSAIDFSMMIHCKALLTMFVFANRIASVRKNQLIQYPEWAYLIAIASQQDWKIPLHWVNHVFKATARSRTGNHSLKVNRSTIELW